MKRDIPERLYVTRTALEAFDARMGLPGLGMRYVEAGVFVIVEELNMDTTFSKKVPA